MRLKTLSTYLLVAVALTACGTAARPSATAAHRALSSASPIATVAATVAASAAVVKPVVIDATYVADELGGVEQAIRLPDTPS
ncbi:MAG TPA: hypothetical protein VFR68_13950, partial [Candidatus Dormibacteraeota bacterium]|nr:hypothetical protein [Candidatus Dormibacteraeota bacterium]